MQAKETKTVDKHALVFTESEPMKEKKLIEDEKNSNLNLRV